MDSISGWLGTCQTGSVIGISRALAAGPPGVTGAHAARQSMVNHAIKTTPRHAESLLVVVIVFSLWRIDWLRLEVIEDCLPALGVAHGMKWRLIMIMADNRR